MFFRRLVAGLLAADVILVLFVFVGALTGVLIDWLWPGHANLIKLGMILVAAILVVVFLVAEKRSR